MKKQLLPFLVLSIVLIHTTASDAMDLNQVVREISLFRQETVLGASATTVSGMTVSKEQTSPSALMAEDKKMLVLRDLRDSQDGKPVMQTSVRYGSSGSDVVKLQIFLIAKGYLLSEPTGNFLAQTKDALIRFQRDQSITGGDGMVSGPKTNLAINTIIYNETGGMPGH